MLTERHIHQAKILLQENRKAEAISILFEQMGMMSKAKAKLLELEIEIQNIPPLKAGKEIANDDLDLKTEALALLAEESRIAAIKFVREKTGLGLKESKNYVDDLQKNFVKSVQTQLPESLNVMEEALKTEVLKLIAENKKIVAVKFVKEKTGLGLKESKNYVDKIQEVSS